MYPLNYAPPLSELKRYSVNCGFGECVGPVNAGNCSTLGELAAPPKYRTDLPKFTAEQLGRVVAFPYPNRDPYYVTATTTTGPREVLNIGAPMMQNDPREYLRSAMVASDWDAVEKYLAWLAANGAEFDEIANLPLGSFKYIVSGGKKIYLGFSDQELRDIFTRFKRFANGDAATEKCIASSIEKTRKMMLSRPNQNQPIVFSLGVCNKKGPWWRGFLMAAALVAAIYGGATLIYAALGSSAGAAGATGAVAAGGGGAGATGAASALGFGYGGQAALALAAPALETVTVLGTVGAGVSAGTAAALTAGAVGAGALAAGAGGASAPASAAPTSADPSSGLEEVTVTATRATPPAIPSTLIDAATGAAIIATNPTAPNAPASADQLPPEEKSYLDQLVDWLKEQGIQFTTDQLAAWLMERLGRAPTKPEFDYIAGGAGRPFASGFDFTKILPIIAILFATAIVLPEKGKR